ncbi:hypothetical protein [Thermococcus sp.]|uniref:hypothetical protein n=1 Tax=Thermococcus sp. TaxID=35749 RepID=UPI00262AA096|nr:hypothetical protein [Thermococcus sp.]
MFEIVKILYRELHYRRLKNNPQIAADPKKFKEQLRKTGDIKRGIAFQSVAFLFFGLMMAGAVVTVGGDDRAAILLATYSLLPFIMALYTTTVNASYSVSMGIFEPLKPLPVRTGAEYLSLLLALDCVPSVIALLPAVVGMVHRNPLAGTVGMLWILVGAFLGHVLGLVLFTFSGSSGVGGRLSGLRSLVRVVGVFLFVGMFYFLNYIQGYVNEHYEELLPFFERYSIAYPFSVASILEPLNSFLLALGYLAVLVPVYAVTLRKLWRRIEEGFNAAGAGVSTFVARTHHPVVALAIKDFTIVLRKSALLVGLVFPLFVVMPSAVKIFTSGQMGEWSVASVLLTVAWMSSLGVDAALKIDGREFEVLRGLPVTLGQFIEGKLIIMSAVPVLSGVIIVVAASFFSPFLLKLLPAAVVLPLTASSLTLAFFYHGERDLSVPETGFGHVFILMILDGLVLGIVAVLWYFLGYPYAMVLAGGVVIAILRSISR